MAVIAASGLGLGAPAPARAQETANQQSGQMLEEIVVTARFREERLQSTPVAITAFTSEMLDARSYTDIIDVAQAAPNVNMTEGSSGFGTNTNQAFIRGLGQADFNFAFEPRVGFYIDDVYYATTYGAVFDLLDIDRVEVLRGPQGTLFGRNSVGGALRILTKDPLGDGTGYVEGQAGSNSRLGVKGAMDMPIVEDKLMLRMAAGIRREDGWVDHYSFKCLHPELGGNLPGVGQGHIKGCKIGELGGGEVFTTRNKLRWVINEDVETTVTFDYTHDRSEAAAESIIDLHLNQQNPATGEGNPALTNGLARWFDNYGDYWDVSLSPEMIDALNPADPYRSTAIYGNQRVGYSNPPTSSFEAWGLSNNLEWQISDILQLTSITAYRTYDGDFGQSTLAIPAQEVRNGNHNEQFSQEVRLQANLLDNRLETTFGAFYLDSDSRNQSRVQTEGFTMPLDFITNDPYTLRSWAVFAHGVFRATERLSITAGVRYTDERKTFTVLRDYPPFAPPFGVAAGFVSDFTQKDEFSTTRVNPRVSLDYHWTEDFMTYASVATGFTAGGFNPRPFTQADVFGFGPEDVRTYEAGFKSEFLDRRARLNVSAYYTDYEGIQITLQGCPTCRSSSPFYYDNGGDAKIRGIEVESEFTPIAGWLNTFSLGYTDFDYTSLNPQAQNLTLDSPQTRVPKWQLSFGTQYEINLGDTGFLTPRFDISYRSDIPFSNDADNDFAEQDGYALANARVTWRNADRDWSVAFAVTNVFDKLYYTYIADQRDSFGWAYGNPGRPRQWRLTVRRNF